MTTYLGSCLDDPLGDFCLATDTNGMVLADLLYKLVLRHGFGMVIDMEALCLKSLDGLLADVLENEQLKVFIVVRV